jgi:small subunit ribosomal protein S2
MKKAPDLIFIIDTVKEKIAVQEANCLNIPIVAPIDTNCDPDPITYPIPGNDDAIRSVQLFCKEMAEAINEGKALREQDSEGEVAPKEDTKEQSAPIGDISDAEKEALIKEAEAEEKLESEVDDLTKLAGIGKVSATKLNDMGCKTFADVANISEDKIEEIAKELKFKGDFKDVIAEAKKLVG